MSNGDCENDVNTRIGLRISPDERAKIDAAIKNGNCKTLSEFMRKALEAQLSRAWERQNQVLPVVVIAKGFSFTKRIYLHRAS
jgi:uncharacterized protein (DUF1778 family)